MDYVIVSDMSLDIEHEFIKTHDIKFIPMEYVLGEDTFQCNGPESDEMMHNFYEKLREEVPTHKPDCSEQLCRVFYAVFGAGTWNFVFVVIQRIERYLFIG